MTKKEMGKFSDKLFNLCEWKKQEYEVNLNAFLLLMIEFGFPHQKHVKNPDKLPTIHRIFLDNIPELKKHELEDSQNNKNDKKKN